MFLAFASDVKVVVGMFVGVGVGVCGGVGVGVGVCVMCGGVVDRESDPLSLRCSSGIKCLGWRVWFIPSASARSGSG